jgi:hypothetical protein
MLALIEGTPLVRNDAYNKILHGLATTYGSSFTAGHRLLSLATDVARYYRTMRIDYKFKVDEGGKTWAVRNMKLRSARRISYLSSMLHFVAQGPRIQYDVQREFDVGDVFRFMLDMNGNPGQRLLSSAARLGGGRSEIESVLSLYNVIHAQLSDPALRQHLENLDTRRKFDDRVYESIRANCSALHKAAAELILSLDGEQGRELLEMFLL